MSPSLHFEELLPTYCESLGQSCAARHVELELGTSVRRQCAIVAACEDEEFFFNVVELIDFLNFCATEKSSFSLSVLFVVGNRWRNEMYRMIPVRDNG